MKDFLLYYRGFPPVERNPLLNGGLHRQVCEAATHRDAPEEGFESSSPPKSSFPHESGIELCGRQASYPLDHSGCEEWCRKGGFPHPHRSSGRGVCPAQFWLFVRRRGCFSIGRSRVLVNCRQTHGLLASATQRNKQQIHQNSKQEITTLIIIIISNSNDKKNNCWCWRPEGPRREGVCRVMRATIESSLIRNRAVSGESFAGRFDCSCADFIIISTTYISENDKQSRMFLFPFQVLLFVSSDFLKCRLLM